MGKVKMNQPMVSIIFPTFNGWHDTKECLDSIGKLNYPRQKLEVIIVDNASSDETVTEVRKLTGYGLRVKNERKKSRISKTRNSLTRNLLTVKLVQNKENLGFSKAVNQGIKESKGDLILITNNDVVFDKDYLTNLVDFLQKTPKAGIVGGKVFYKKPKNKVAFPGGKFNFYSGLLRPNKFPDKIFATDWVTGCDMLVKKEVIERIGLLDEKFFFFFEDLDFCLRAKKAGYKVLYYPKAIAFHGEGISIDKVNWQKKSEYYYYGKIRVLFKHANLLQIICALLFQYFVGMPFQQFVLKHPSLKISTKALLSNLGDLILGRFYSDRQN